MPRLTKNCSICDKLLVEVGRAKFDDTHQIVSYKCGHSLIVENAEKIYDLDFASTDGVFNARNYQEIGVDFAVNGTDENPGGFNCLIADQMRLGKTPQALLALKNRFTERTPCLILVKSANMWQWIREYKRWTSLRINGIFPIIGSKNFIPPGFSTYICSMDTFARNGMMERLQNFGFKLVIVDEAHNFKNSASKRAIALVAFLKEINRADLTHTINFNCPICKNTWSVEVTVRIDSNEATRSVQKTSACDNCGAHVTTSAKTHVKVTRKCGVIMLTGTPLLNRADEYYIPLNILAPEKFPSKENFQRTWLDKNSKGQYASVKQCRLESFKDLIKPYVLRREKEDVYNDLPELNRIYTIIEPDNDPTLKAAYNKILDDLEEKRGSKANLSYFETIGELAELRRICGLLKVNNAKEYAEEMIGDGIKKVAIGIHHEDVRDVLAYSLEEFGTMKLSGEDKPERKDWIMRDWEVNDKKVLVINTLAGGVGMDFRYCDNALVLERQWNPQLEEQFEFRFYNPDKSMKDRPTFIEYLLAAGTIDEFFHDMGIEKAHNTKSVMSNNWNPASEPIMFKELLNKTIESRLK